MENGDPIYLYYADRMIACEVPDKNKRPLANAETSGSVN
jgi:hypothetical protein